MGKMTGEALNKALGWATDLNREHGEGLCAHIAALTDELAIQRAKHEASDRRAEALNAEVAELAAELDELRDVYLHNMAGLAEAAERALAEARTEREALRLDLVRVAEFAHQGGTGEPTTEEGREAVVAVGRLLSERDGALEREAITGRNWTADKGVDNATITALRERMQALDAEVRRVRDERERWRKDWENCDEHLAAIRQRASDGKTLAEVYRRSEAKWKHDAFAEVGRHILGDDAPEREVCSDPSTVEGAHKLGTNSAPDVAGEAPAPMSEAEHDAEQRERDRDGWTELGFRERAPVSELDGLQDEAYAPFQRCCGGTDERPPRHTQDCVSPAETTTAEAFATVRENVKRITESIYMATGTATLMHLSLLEHRMGVMERAMRLAIAEDECSAATSESLRSALTDAPGVWTWDDIEKALAPWTERGLLISEVLGRLAALRRKP